MDNIIKAVLLIGGIGLFIGIFLGIAAIIFKVTTNQKEEEILALLPGINCGACGFAGCSNLAAAIAKGDAKTNGCPVGGAAVAVKIAGVMGVENEETSRLTAFVMCGGTNECTSENFEYSGTKDCKIAAMVAGGSKSCEYGCLGYGSCVNVCLFDAIHIENGIAIVNKQNCTACGKCVSVCPRNLIELIPFNAIQRVQCVSTAKGSLVTKACTVGCIGCGICARNCPVNAITITDLCAKIDYSLCTNCGICVEKCPRKIIIV